MEQEKSCLKTVFGSFIGKDGYLSTSKVLSFIGFIFFIIVSFIVLFKTPERFNYELFAVLSGGGAVGSRVIDKWLNIRSSEVKK